MKFFLHSAILMTGMEIFFVINLFAQDSTGLSDDKVQNAVESMMEQQDQEVEEDEFLQQLQYYRHHPLNINKASANALSIFPFLTPVQIQNFLSYRHLLGPLISVYELQAVPGFDLSTIKTLLPFIKITNEEDNYSLKNYFHDGENNLLLRYERTLEQAKGFIQKDKTHYLGDANKIMLRYVYVFHNHLNYGITADKDAGEQFFKGQQTRGFDFYSAHLFLKNYHALKALAIGDFTVNMGQGLINWQGFAFNKSALVLNIKRQSDILKPYTSPGEIYFYRGAGTTWKYKHWESTLFVSSKKIDANTDSSNGKFVITSLPTSGYHRTASEIADAASTRLITYGGNITYKIPSGHVGINFIHHHLSNPLQKKDALYNLYSFSGRQLTDMSIDYSFTFHNLHAFGETAMSNNFRLATINSLLMSLSRKTDLGLVYRNYNKAYHALYPDAFGEGSSAANEQGLYATASTAFGKAWQASAYADIFNFPWLRYRVNAPSHGEEYFLQLNYQSSNQWQINMLYRKKNKQLNSSTNPALITESHLQNFRINFRYLCSPQIILQTQINFTRYNDEQTAPQNGWLIFQQLSWKPGKIISGQLRFTAFNIDSYDARIYTFENDVLYAFSVPFFYQKGIKYYVNWRYNFNRYLAFYGRWSQIIYSKNSKVGSGLDEIAGHKKSAISLEVYWQF